MPLPEPTDLDKAGHLKFEELEASLKQMNKEIQGIFISHKRFVLGFYRIMHKSNLSV